jgi:hypothetical protein
MYPQVLDPDYNPKKKKQKSQYKLFELVDLFGDKYTSDELRQRLDKRQRKFVDEQSDLILIQEKLYRHNEKLESILKRIDLLKGERETLEHQNIEEKLKEREENSKRMSIRRQQSAAYKRLNPIIDYEINYNEFERSLQEVNSNLLNKKEINYIYHILNIPGRQRLSLRLFSLIAALSERIIKLEPFVRKLINKFDFEALDVKMNKAKGLFYLMAERSSSFTPHGYVTIQSMGVELAAGGISMENVNYVI